MRHGLRSAGSDTDASSRSTTPARQTRHAHAEESAVAAPGLEVHEAVAEAVPPGARGGRTRAPASAAPNGSLQRPPSSKYAALLLAPQVFRGPIEARLQGSPKTRVEAGLGVVDELLVASATRTGARRAARSSASVSWQASQCAQERAKRGLRPLLRRQGDGDRVAQDDDERRIGEERLEEARPHEIRRRLLDEQRLRRDPSERPARRAAAPRSAARRAS